MRATYVALIAVGCGSKGKPPPVTAPEGPVVIVDDAPLPPDPLPELAAIGEHQRERLELRWPVLTGTDDSELLAFGPCRRLDVPQQAAVTARIRTWMAKAYAADNGNLYDDAPKVAFGCADTQHGIIVDVQADRGRPPQHPIGRWWTLRVGDDIKVLAELKGSPESYFSEYAIERTLHTIALADLDHDGVLDPIVTRVDHEGGSSTNRIELLTPLSSAPAVRPPIAELGDTIELPRGQRRDATTVVVKITTHGHESHPAYRCIDGGTTLARCHDAEIARTVDRALATAAAIGESLPDRDEMDAQLTLLELSPRQRAPWLAIAKPTTTAQRTGRAVARFVDPVDDRTDTERRADDEAEANAWLGRLATELGDQRCIKPPRDRELPKLRAWIAAHDRGTTTNVEILGMCVGPNGGAYFASWWHPTKDPQTSVHRQAVFARRTTGSPVAIFEATAQGFPYNGAGGAEADPGLDATFYLHDDSVVALVLDHDHKLSAVVDGTVVGTHPGPQDWYRVGELRAEMLIRAEGEPIVLWHADHRLVPTISLESPSLAATPPPPGAARLVFEREQLLEARNELASYADGHALGPHEEDLALALELVGADPQLVARVRRN